MTTATTSATTGTNGTSKGKAAEKTPAARTHSGVIVLALSSILVDWKKNSREKAYDAEDKRDKTDWEAFKAGIEDSGMLEPMIVRPLATKGKKGETHELVAGYRRYTAASELGWADGPCVVREATTDIDAMAINLEENLGRKDLHPAEAVQGLARFRDACVKSGLTVTGAYLSAKVGKSKSHVNNMLRIADNLIKPALRAFYDKKVPIERAIQWAGLEKADQEAAWAAFLKGQENGGEGEEGGEGSATEKPKTLTRAKIEEMLGKLGKAETIKVSGGETFTLGDRDMSILAAALGYILKPKTDKGNDRNPFKYAPEDAADGGES